MVSKKLKQNFFRRKAEDVARELIGRKLVRNLEEKILSGIIIETEVHSREQKRTPKTEGAFADAGIIHMYPSQGKLILAIATGDFNEYSEISIRALKPLEGIERMIKNRGTRDYTTLTNGPGKLTQALQITKDFNGKAIYDSHELWIEGESANNSQIVYSKQGNSKDSGGVFKLKDNTE
ncbi:MAG: DNA-3-methyladenine glycosylase [Candidatus Pacearchaeota archaeon]